MKGRCHDIVEFTQYFLFGPEVVHVALNLFKIAAGNSAGVGQKIGNHENVSFFQNLVRFGSSRAVGAFDNYFYFLGILFDGIGIDLILQSGGDQDINFLGNPGFGVCDFVAQAFGFCFVNAAEFVGDAEQFFQVDAALLDHGVGFVFLLVPIRHANRFAAVLLVQFYGILRNIPEALERGAGFFDIDDPSRSGLL